MQGKGSQGSARLGSTQGDYGARPSQDACLQRVHLGCERLGRRSFPLCHLRRARLLNCRESVSLSSPRLVKIELEANLTSIFSVLRAWGEHNLEENKTGSILCLSASCRFTSSLILLPVFAHQPRSDSSSSSMDSRDSHRLFSAWLLRSCSGRTWRLLVPSRSFLLSFEPSLTLFISAQRCSRKLHDSSFKALMRSPLSYFESTPQGR